MKFIRRYQEFIKFGVVAVSYNFIAYVIYVSLLYFNCNYLIASTISFFIGVILSYFMNKFIVFPVKDPNHTLIIRYFIFYLLLLCANLVLLHEFISLLKINPYYAQILVTFIAALISYNTMRIFIFRRQSWLI